jgi:SAM-dependent methyltransferase
MNDGTHDRLIVDQFTRQATPFTTARALNDERALRSIVEACAPEPGDHALDVACGGGIVTCALAPHVGTVTGVDMTPAMLERARTTALEKGVENAVWQAADATALPFEAGRFSIVVTRYSFHHLLDPLRTLREMARVCRPGGRVVVVDMYASERPDQAAEWNRLERLRDPSHVRILPLSELAASFEAAGLPAPSVSFHEIRDTVDRLLARSFPDDGDAPKIRAIFRASVDDGRLGIECTLDGDAIRYAYPTAILSAVRT